MDFADDRLALDAVILAGVVTLTLHAGRMFARRPPPPGDGWCPAVRLATPLRRKLNEDRSD